MNIAYRVAKVAALLFMTVALAVFVSCNLAGDQGDTGDTGTTGGRGLQGPKGDTGGTGTSGQGGIDALQMKGTVVSILVNDKAGAAGDPRTVDLSTYFVGGDEDKKYAFTPGTTDNPTNPPAPGTPAVPVATLDGSMLTVNVKGIADGDEAYATHNVLITVTDGGGRKATVTIPVGRNKAPAPVTNVTIEDLRIGTQPDAVPTVPDTSDDWVPTLFTCKTYDVCELDLSSAFDEMGLTYTPKHAVTTDSAKVSVMPSAMGVMITGLQSTVATVGDAKVNAENQQITINVKATDKGTLTSADAITFKINVDAQPIVKPGVSIPARVTVELDENLEGYYVVAGSVAGWFSDPEGAALEYACMSEDDTVATVDSDCSATGEGIADKLVVRGVSLGSTTITVTATEAGRINEEGPTGILGQFVKRTIQVSAVRK
jgi:hypothetical protein